MNNTHCTQTLLASNNDDADDNDPDNICLFNFLYWLFLTPETWHIVLPIQLWFKRFKSNIVKSILFQNWNKNKKEIHVHVVVWLFKGW